MSVKEQAGLSGLDWFVIVAATLALLLLTVWMAQGQPTLRRKVSTTAVE